MTNRFQQLVDLVPYRGRGQTLPKRSTPYEFLFPTSSPNTQFGLFVNGVFVRVIRTDATGTAVVLVDLGPGDQTIELVDQQAQSTFRAYATVRSWATLLAAHADVYEQVDADIQEIRESLAIASGSPRYLESRYGRAVGQTNTGDYDPASYRNMLLELRQAYRLFSGKRAGLKTAVQAVTCVNPFLVPKLWRPRFIPDGQLAVAGLSPARIKGIQVEPSAIPGQAPNAIATVTDALTTWTPLFDAALLPARLQVVFDPAWTGGTLTIEGTDQSGLPVSDRFVPPGTVQGQERFVFAEITRISVASIGAGAVAQVGLAEDVFVRVLSARGPLATTAALTYQVGTRQLQLGDGVPETVYGPGVYTLTDGYGRSGAYVAGRALEPIGASRAYQGRRLRIAVDQGPPIDVPVAPVGFTTLAAAVNAINSALRRSAAYGATRSERVITVTSLPPEGATITLTDADGATVTLEADTDGLVAAGNIPFENNALVISPIAAAISAALNRQGRRLRAAAGADTVRVLSSAGGNVPLTFSTSHPAAFTSTFTAGAEAALTPASVLSDGETEALQVTGGSAARGPNNSASVLASPAGDEGVFFDLGETRLAAAVTAGALTVTVTDGARLPNVPAVQLVARTDAATTAAVIARQPEWATSCEVLFSPSYNGGSVFFDGQTCDGAAVSETIQAPPERAIASGTGLSGSGNRAVALPNLPVDVRPGALLRITSGTFSGVERRIVARDQDTVLLESGPGGGIASATWVVLTTRRAATSTPFHKLTTVRLTSAGNRGHYEVRVADAETYGARIRLGRGSVASGTGAALLGTTAGPVDRLQSLDFPMRPDLRLVEISGGTAYAGANNGLHRVAATDLASYGFPEAGRLIIEHEWAAEGGLFSPGPIAPGDYTSVQPETGLAWTVYSGGEPAVVIAKDGNTLTLAAPLVSDKAANALVEPDLEAIASQAALDRGLGEVQVEVNPALAPLADSSDSLTFYRSDLPRGWRTFNIGGASVTLWGSIDAARLRFTPNGLSVFGLGMTVTVPIESGAQYAGRRLSITAFVGHAMGQDEDFRLDISFDGGFDFVLGAPVTVATGVELAGVGNFSAAPVTATAVVPTDATQVVARVAHIRQTVQADEVVYLEGVIATVEHASGMFLGDGTVAYSQAFGDLVYLWSPEALTLQEQDSIGLTARGHIDEVTHAHGDYARYSIERVEGVYDESAWLDCALANLSLNILTPARFSYVSPTAPSLVEQEALTFSAPSNATLQNLSRHEGIFPQAAERLDRLYEDGVPVPAGAWPGQRAVAQIGSYLGANGTVEIEALQEGIAANGFTVEVDATTGTARPLRATFDAASGALRVELRVLDTQLLANENRALMVAAAINQTGLFVATALGTGAGALNQSEGPTPFAGAQSTPWRFVSPQQVQIASAAAGDSASEAEYPSGLQGAPSGRLVFSPQSEYAVDYEVLTRATSPAIDLGADHADYVWLPDVGVSVRREAQVGQGERVVSGIVFSPSRQARLSEPSTRDQTESRLLRDDGVRRVEVPWTDWRYVDDSTIEVSEFDADAIYTLEYQAVVVSWAPTAEVTVEHRGALDPTALATAAWRVAAADKPALRPAAEGPQRYAQIRITINGVRDTRDVRIKSMGFRGIRLHGTSPVAPGIISCDEE